MLSPSIKSSGVKLNPSNQFCVLTIVGVDTDNPMIWYFASFYHVGYYFRSVPSFGIIALWYYGLIYLFSYDYSST